MARVILIAGLVAGSATATEDLEQARAIFREALVLEVAGDWAAALSKFQEVGRTRLTPQVRYHLARCKEHLGRMTEALGDYRVAEAEARAASLAETAEIERARRDLEARVPTLVLRGGNRVATLRVELDGISIGNALLNRPMVINPGQHQIALRTSAGVIRTMLVNAEEGRRIDIDLQRFDQTPVFYQGAAPLPPEPSPPTATPNWAYWAIGGGSASIVASTVLFLIREHAKNELADKCAGRLCDEELRSVQQRGEVASVVAPIALGVGVAALGAGFWGIYRGVQRPSVSRGQRGNSTIAAAAWPGGCGVNIATSF